MNLSYHVYKKYTIAHNSNMDFQISQEEGLFLIQTARHALEKHLLGKDSPKNKIIQFSPKLHEKHGIFVTLWKQNEMRGCIGSPFPEEPLESAAQTFALLAATEDRRFTPLEPSDLSHIKIEISIITSLFPIQPSQIKLGTHGLLIFKEGSTGLLFPQLAMQNRWDVTTYLEQLCLKAYLPRDAWQQGAELHGFEMQIFTESAFESAATLL